MNEEKLIKRIKELEENLDILSREMRKSSYKDAASATSESTGGYGT